MIFWLVKQDVNVKDIKLKRKKMMNTDIEPAERII